MTQISPSALPFFALSVMSSIDYGSRATYTIHGQVIDEKGDYVNGADVMIESTMDRRHMISAGDGSFYTDICVNGFSDEIFIKALFGLKLGLERIIAHGSYISIDIMIRDIKN